MDMEQQLDYYLANGYVYSSPRGLIWAEVWRDKTWLVYLAIGAGAVPEFLQAMPFWLPTVGFCRLLRGKHKLMIHPMARICRAYKVDPEPLKQRSLP